MVTPMLSQDESRLIEQAIGAAETATSAEIAVCIRRASGDDRGLAAGAGAAAAILAFLLLRAAWPEGDVFFFLAVVPAVAITVFLVCDKFDLGLKLLPAGLLANSARGAARVLFLDRALDATPQRNAVLLFISRAERYVEILPDRGLAAAVPPQRWINIVASFQEMARQKGMVAAATDAIGQIGAVCAGPFPASAENPDHLSNRPITD
jgi:putative membrane protein